MKKILFSLIAFSVITYSASAQIQKGSFYIGGDLSYNYDQAGTTTVTQYTTGTTYYTNYHISNFELSPEFGVFLTNKLTLGVQLGYNRVSGTEINNYVAADNTTTSYVRTDTYQTNAIIVGLHLRYYWMLSDRVGIFPQLGLNTANNTSNLNYGTLTLALNPNIVFFATKKLAVNMSFGNLAYNLDYNSKSYTINLGLNNNISFGLNYYW